MIMKVFHNVVLYAVVIHNLMPTNVMYIHPKGHNTPPSWCTLGLHYLSKAIGPHSYGSQSSIPTGTLLDEQLPLLQRVAIYVSIT